MGVLLLFLFFILLFLRLLNELCFFSFSRLGFRLKRLTSPPRHQMTSIKLTFKNQHHHPTLRNTFFVTHVKLSVVDFATVQRVAKTTILNKFDVTHTLLSSRTPLVVSEDKKRLIMTDGETDDIYQLFKRRYQMSSVFVFFRNVIRLVTVRCF